MDIQFTEFNLFVDYDNLLKDWDARRSDDIDYLIDKIIENMDTNIFTEYNKCNFRLYGGWYSGRSMTRAAQNLSSKIEMSFPKTINIDGAKKIQIKVEIATSMYFKSSLLIQNTLRRRSVNFLKSSKSPRDMGCRTSPCSLDIVRETLRSGVCQHEDCPAKLDDMLNLYEQKQVDMMIGVDILEFTDTPTTICLITSDDDLIPAIIKLVYCGTTVIHLSGKNSVTATSINWNAFSGKYTFRRI